VTLWGDVLAPHGDEFWLATLIDLAQALAINDRLVRTTAFRLSQEGWLTARRLGRQSRYRLTPDGERRVVRADARIYLRGNRDWDGKWTLLLFEPSLTGSRYLALCDELRWQGFAEFAPRLYGHPAGQGLAVSEILASTRTRAEVTLFQASAEDAFGKAALTTLVSRSFELAALARRYLTFIDDFAPALENCRELQDIAAFALRVRLVHAYRRVLLHDPQLPHALLPPEWPGHRAFNLARALYGGVIEASERWIEGVLQGDADAKRARLRLAERFPITQAA